MPAITYEEYTEQVNNKLDELLSCSNINKEIISACLIDEKTRVDIEYGYDSNSRSEDVAYFIAYHIISAEYRAITTILKMSVNDIHDYPKEEVLKELYNGWRIMDTPMLPCRYKIEQNGPYVRDNAGWRYFRTVEEARSEIDKHAIRTWRD